MTELVITAVIAKVIKKAGFHACGFGVGVDVAQGIEGALSVVVGEAVTTIALLPKVTFAIEQSIKGHGGVPVDPVHNFGQIIGFFGFDQVMDMVEHNAQSIEFEVIFVLGFFDDVQKGFADFATSQVKFAVIATGGDVVAVVGFKFACESAHYFLVE